MTAAQPSHPAPFEVSVVIPLFNKAAYIGAALESVLAQTHPPREILVIDDGSTDEGPEIVGSFGAKAVRIIRQPNAGPGAARNRGIEQSTQPWIAFLDADDWWLPDHLAHLAELHRQFPDVAVLATGLEQVWGDNPVIPKPCEAGTARKIDFFTLAPEGPGLSSSSVAVTAEALEAVGGFGAPFPGEDVELWIRLGLRHLVVLSSKLTALYRRNGQGLTHDYLSAVQKPSERLPIFAPLEAALADPTHLARHPLLTIYRDRWLRLLARQALARGNSRLARSYLADVAKIDQSWLFLAALATLPARWLRRAVDTRRAIPKFKRHR